MTHSRQPEFGSTPEPSSQSGFTLIEIIIVVAIVGIVTAFAYPSYTEYVKKTRRTDGHLAMLEAIQGLERCKSTSYTYVGCTLTKTESPEKFYGLELDPAPTATTFTIKATAQGAQVNDTDCEEMTMDHLGVVEPEDCRPNK